MERFEEVVPLYLKACEVEGKTDRTVQSYAETLRHFRRAVDQLQLPNSVRAFGPAHVYLFMGWVKERGVSAGTQHRRQRERSGGSHGGVCLVEQSSSRKDRGRTVPERVVEVEKGGGVFGWHKPHSSLARAATRLITDKHFKMCTFDQESRTQTQAPAPVRPSRTRCLARDGRE